MASSNSGVVLRIGGMQSNVMKKSLSPSRHSMPVQSVTTQRVHFAHCVVPSSLLLLPWVFVPAALRINPAHDGDVNGAHSELQFPHLQMERHALFFNAAAILSESPLTHCALCPISPSSVWPVSSPPPHEWMNGACWPPPHINRSTRATHVRVSSSVAETSQGEPRVECFPAGVGRPTAAMSSSRRCIANDSRTFFSPFSPAVRT